MVACGVTERRVIPFQNLLCVFLQRQRVFFEQSNNRYMPFLSNELNAQTAVADNPKT